MNVLSKKLDRIYKKSSTIKGSLPKSESKMEKLLAKVRTT
ncbi:Protein of unknown function [Lactobacillus delbrueckii subsp. lactis]|nr:Protein of unknown function [Lactobacillus delbrueckii subsp. lactis]